VQSLDYNFLKMPLITPDDFSETYSKLKQRGLVFILSKFNLRARSRTMSAFNEWDIEGSNWWMIPEVQQRWNEKISGNRNINISSYISYKYLIGSGKIVSVGCGSCTQELLLAAACPHWTITCIDIAENLITEAKGIAIQQGLTNIEFKVADVVNEPLPVNEYDAVFFHSSLHHFYQVYHFLKNNIKPSLKTNGLIFIFEMTGSNRLQFPKHQLKEINRLLLMIPKAWRKRYKTNRLKKRVTGPGLLRMMLADPSECADSSSILPSLHSLFTIVEEKPIGENLMMLLLKDIAHHFIEEVKEKKELLYEFFRQEDEYLKTNPPDFVFGVYRKEKGLDGNPAPL
jgi:ubiquinone/menaquinone biosynthesis C-methylase UbiE